MTRLLVALMVLALTSCEPAPVVIPPGAQVVHVRVTDESVRIAPATVRAGDVYFVNEGPATGFALVRRSAAPDAELEGMTRDQVDAVARGDYELTSIEGFAVGCEPDQWTDERGWADCRPNAMVTLTEGFYAILGSGGDQPGVPPVMDVLEVVP